MPSPTSFVVENGSKMRRSVSSSIPGPSSWELTRIAPSRCSVRTVSVPRPLAASIDCSALMITLRKTCWIWFVSTIVLGSFGSSSRFRSMLFTCRSYVRISKTRSSSRLTLASSFSACLRRANESRFWTILAARSASSWIVSMSRSVCSSRSRASSSWEKPMMPVSGLFSSCATPETSCPTDTIFSDCTSRSCISRSSVTSRTITTAAEPSGEPASGAAIATR